MKLKKMPPGIKGDVSENINHRDKSQRNSKKPSMQTSRKTPISSSQLRSEVRKKKKLEKVSLDLLVHRDSTPYAFHRFHEACLKNIITKWVVNVYLTKS